MDDVAPKWVVRRDLWVVIHDLWLGVDQRKIMIVLCCGGRNFNLPELVDNALSGLSVTKIVAGDATGLDTLARNWALENGVEYEGYPINSDDRKYGPGVAGNRRNRRMFLSSMPDLVVAFTGGSGTEDMVGFARSMGTPVIEVHMKR
jgi:hypothetical protein